MIRLGDWWLEARAQLVQKRRGTDAATRLAATKNASPEAGGRGITFRYRTCASLPLIFPRLLGAGFGTFSPMISGPVARASWGLIPLPFWMSYELNIVSWPAVRQVLHPVPREIKILTGITHLTSRCFKSGSGCRIRTRPHHPCISAISHLADTRTSRHSALRLPSVATFSGCRDASHPGSTAASQFRCVDMLDR